MSRFSHIELDGRAVVAAACWIALGASAFTDSDLISFMLFIFAVLSTNSVFHTAYVKFQHWEKLNIKEGEDSK